MSDQIEIKIEAKRLPPDAFLAGAKDFFALVEGVAKNVTTVSIKWGVEVDKGSAVVRMRAENPTRDSATALSIVSQGLKALGSGTRVIPKGFTVNELWAARRLAKLSDGEDVQGISIKNGGKPELLRQSVAQSADAILAGQSQNAFGSIEGKLVSLSARQGLLCVIYDPLQRREVTCYLQSDQAQKEVLSGFNRRVLAGGLIHYAKEGYAVSITVDNIQVFPSDSDLPSLEDVQAVYKQYK